MSDPHPHDHVTAIRAQLRSGRTRESFAAVVGTVEQSTEHPITGRNGDHLQFYLDVGGGQRYQVDVNTQSRDGRQIGVYIADQDVDTSGTSPVETFGAPAFGLFADARLSYRGMGLNDADFSPLDDVRIDQQLEAALGASHFVSVYGMTFDDGGANGKGIHETHYNVGQVNQDGAVLVYQADAATGQPKRTWFFFRFQEDHIG